MIDFPSNIPAIVEQIQDYRVNGLTLGQKDGDTGDSAQRTGLYYGLIALSGETDDGLYNRDMDLLEASSGVYRRSPIKDFWGYNPDNLSRDQLSVLKTAMAARGDKTRLRRVLVAQLKRGFFHQNTHLGADDPLGKWKIPDLPTLNEFGVFIRGLDLWYLKPLLYLTDLDLCASIYFRKQNLWDADNMIAFQMLYANKKYPTFLSKLAWGRYLNTDFQDRIEYYYREDNNNNGLAPLGELYNVVIEKAIGDVD